MGHIARNGLKASDHEGQIMPSVSGWPAALSFEEALNYTGLSPKVLRDLERRHAIRFLRVGRCGRRLVLRSELDQLLAQLFDRPASREDFDFG